MLGSMVTSMSQRMIRLATTALMVSGAGLAGYSYYLDQYKAADPRANAAITFFQEHATWFIALGVAGLVLGFVLNMVMMRRMTKRMMGGMGMPGMGGMPSGMMQGMGGLDPQTMQAMQGLSGSAAREVVKVRCKACSSLELEAAAFCSKCGKPMA
ncbi:MAG: hypothetical protein WC876_07765 [Candidatus Thermoplasmatota archaeon]|jgi:hypothetical protein